MTKREINAMLRRFEDDTNCIGFEFLPSEQLRIAVAQPDASKRIIGGAREPWETIVVFVTGTGQRFDAPFAFFAPTPDGVYPDFDDISFGDCGQKVSFGRYEVSTGSILGWFDAAYREKSDRWLNRPEGDISRPPRFPWER